MVLFPNIFQSCDSTVIESRHERFDLKKREYGVVSGDRGKLEELCDGDADFFWMDSAYDLSEDPTVEEGSSRIDSSRYELICPYPFRTHFKFYWS